MRPAKLCKKPQPVGAIKSEGETHQPRRAQQQQRHREECDGGVRAPLRAKAKDESKKANTGILDSNQRLSFSRKFHKIAQGPAGS
jgi:hypothetical protein